MFCLVVISSSLFVSSKMNDDQQNTNRNDVIDDIEEAYNITNNSTIKSQEKQGEWKLVFEEDFSGTSLATEKWEALGRKKNFNNELQEYRPENAVVRDGRLFLTGRKERDRYTSGLVQTRKKFEFLYGKVEVKAKYPSGKGLFPAIWLLRADGKDSLPEIDIFEAIGNEPQIAYFVKHWRHNGTLRTVHDTKEIKNHQEDHVFAVEWEKEAIRWFLDGNLIFETRNRDANYPMYLIMNLAIGGNWPGNPNASTVFPAEFSIDYVKIFEREER